jgi:DNA-binding PadR family transcriptional regulator
VSDNWLSTDLKAMAETLRTSIRQFGGFSPEQVRASGIMGEAALKRHILLSLADGPKTGHEILEWVKESGKSKLKPAAASLYPMLENMADVGLVTIEIKKDRKTYSLTKLGKEEFAASAEEETAADESGSIPWSAPTWIDLKGDLPKSGQRLAKVAVEVVRTGSKDQQDRASKVLDEARRELHEILAEK